MIRSIKDYKEYLKEDRRRFPTPPRFIGFILHTEKYFVWKQIKNLRRLELLMNNRSNLFVRLLYYLQMVRYYRIMHKNQIYVYPNVFGPGLYIPHLGRILTPPHAKVGSNCTLRPGLLIVTNLSVSNRKKFQLEVGDNVEFSEGCKIICRKIGANVVIGPNAVVTINVLDGMTVYSPLCEMMERNV